MNLYIKVKNRVAASVAANNEPDLFSSLKPLYFLMSVLGLFPYSMKFDKLKNCFIVIQKSLFANLVCGICCFLLIVAFYALHLQSIFTDNEKSSYTDIIVTKMNYFIELVTLIFFCLVAYISALRNATTYVKVLNGFASTWTKSPKSERIMKHLAWQVRVALWYLFMITFIHLAINFTREDGAWKITLVTFSFDLPQLIQFVVIAYILVLLQMIVTILRSIQEDISCHVKEEANGRSDKVKSPINTFEVTYSRAFEITRDLNRCFEAPILLTALQCFHSIVSEGHIIYHGVVLQSNLTAHQIVNCFTWVLWQLVKIYALSHAGGLLKLETRKVGEILHNIPTEQQDLRLLLEIQHFTSKIHFQAIELTIYGYFPLDETLIFKVIAAAMMYLIILVQFDKNS